MFRNRQFYKITSATLFLFASSTMSYGQFTTDGVVQFTGEVLSNCSIGNIENGSLLDIATNSSFSGSGGSLDVTTNGGALISVGPPSLTISPAGAELDETQSSATISFDGQQLSDGGGNLTLDQGTTNVSVSLVLFPSTPSGFPTGQYTAATTVTCEFESPPGILG